MLPKWYVVCLGGGRGEEEKAAEKGQFKSRAKSTPACGRQAKQSKAKLPPGPQQGLQSQRPASLAWRRGEGLLRRRPTDPPLWGEGGDPLLAGGRGEPPAAPPPAPNSAGAQLRERGSSRSGGPNAQKGRQAGRQAGREGQQPQGEGGEGGGVPGPPPPTPTPTPTPRRANEGGGGGGGLFAGAVGARPGGDTAEAGTRAGGFAPNCLLAGRKGRGEGRRRGAAGSCSSLPTCLCRRPCRLLGAATFPACLPARSVTKKAHGVTWGGQSLSRAQP